MALIERGLDGGEIPVTVRTADLYETSRTVSVGDRHILNEKTDVVELLGFSLWKPAFAAIIGGVTDKSAAQQAGLQAGDQILSINGEAINGWDDLVSIIQSSADKTLQLLILRGDIEQTLSLRPEAKQRGEDVVGYMGAYPQVDEALINKSRVRVEYSLFEAIDRAITETWTFSALTLKVLGKMLVGEAALENISGPITIAQYAGITASIGFLIYIKFLAMISVSLGVLNLLPVPMLDGGHLMYYLIELVKGSPVSQKVEQMGQQIGITLLFLLMSLAIFNDIQRLLN